MGKMSKMSEMSKMIEEVGAAAGHSRAGRLARQVVVALALTLTIGVARPALAVEAYANDFGIGVGTVFVDLVYMPVKVVYATLGGLTGGFAFLLTGGNLDVASAIWRPSLGGTYVVTPSMLRGDDQIYFSGSADDAETSRDERREEPLGDRDRGRRGEAY
ncbi:MAG: hypothetical protein HY271_05405 [Deltaproteobacteria bacterium]|nr:hypothetical protein [Deltaproteobacteria bacterium]